MKRQDFSKLETPERCRRRGRSNLSEVFDKADKYDVLIGKIKAQKALMEVELLDLKAKESPFKIGFGFGVTSGTVNAYEKFLDTINNNFLEDEV